MRSTKNIPSCPHTLSKSGSGYHPNTKKMKTLALECNNMGLVSEVKTLGAMARPNSKTFH